MACLRNDHWSLLGQTHWPGALSLTIHVIVDLLIFRSPFRITDWKLLSAASAHWFCLCLLRPGWQPSSSFQGTKHFRPGPFGLGLCRYTHALGFRWGYFVGLSVSVVKNQEGTPKWHAPFVLFMVEGKDTWTLRKFPGNLASHWVFWEYVEGRDSKNHSFRILGTSKLSCPLTWEHSLPFPEGQENSPFTHNMLPNLYFNFHCYSTFQSHGWMSSS